MVKFVNFRNKEKILKAAEDKRFLTYNGRDIRLVTDISTETWQDRKGWHDIFRVLNEKNMQPIILYPARLSFNLKERYKAYRILLNISYRAGLVVKYSFSFHLS